MANSADAAGPADRTLSDRTTAKLAVLDPVIQQAIRDGKIPGAVLIVGHDGHVVYRKAYGWRSIDPRREAMTLDTVFDLASLTKPVATTMCVMKLFEQGKIKLNDPVSHYLPEFGQNGKEDITVRQLLVHYSGLRPDFDLEPNWEGKEAAYRLAFAEKPMAPPGSKFIYSDTNFIVLAALVERVSGMPLQDYAAKVVFTPLGMTKTRFVPPATWKKRTAPTEYDEDHVMLRGVVHDPRARRMGGVAGHAGLFSTADDLAKFAQALLSGGRGVLTPLTIEKMTTPQQPPTATAVRGFGWDLDSPFSSNRGELFPVGSYGHTGFTGTSLWIDPLTNSYIVLLTNAVHLKEGNAISLRTRVASAAAAALDLKVDEKAKLRLARITGYNESQSASRRINVRNGQVKTGIDVLEASGFGALHGGPGRRRIGLLTNQTGLDGEGRRTIDVLANAEGVSLEAIFSPEHGANGVLETEDIGNSRDAATGVTIHSVYGGSDAARRPSLEVLKKLDAIVVDIQDVGVRFYTYETTLGYFLEAAAKAEIPIIVLDRPNPITGTLIQGPVSDAGHESFTNYFPLPVRHGMTLGELAKLFNAERGIHAQLTVVPMDGWQRGDWYDETGLEWVNPSPNLRSLTEAALYPGVGLIEGTNVSVGRGTDTPFELVGAPWVNARELAQYLNERGIAGVRFVPVSFTPSASVYAGRQCQGVNIILLDRNVLDAPELGLELATGLRKLYSQQFQSDHVNALMFSQPAMDAFLAGQDPRRIADDWREQLEQFEKVREKYLLYP